MCNFRELMFGTNFPFRVVTKTCQPTPSPSNYVTISDIHSSNRQRNVHICSVRTMHSTHRYVFPKMSERASNLETIRPFAPDSEQRMYANGLKRKEKSFKVSLCPSIKNSRNRNNCGLQ